MKNLLITIGVLVIIILVLIIRLDRAKLKDNAKEVAKHEQNTKALKSAKNTLKLDAELMQKELDSINSLKPTVITEYEVIYIEVETLPADKSLEHYDTWTGDHQESELMNGRAVVDTLRITKANLINVEKNKVTELLSLANHTIVIQSDIIVNQQERLFLQSKMMSEKDSIIDLKDGEIKDKDRQIRGERIKKYVSYAVSGGLIILLLTK